MARVSSCACVASVLAVAVVGGACARASPAAPSGSEPPLSVSTRAPEAARAAVVAPPHASASSGAPPPASRSATAPVEAAAPPTDGPFAPLLAKDKPVVYIATDEVDTHDPAPGRGTSKRTARVTFTVKTVAHDDGTWLAEGEWASVAGAGGADTVLDGARPPASWRVRGDGLEIGDDSEHVVLVRGAALRKAPPGGVCHTTQDRGPYGTTLREICFDALGLVRYTEKNLHGPRRFTLVRARR